MTMLENMAPCASDTTCSASTPYVDGVALFVFPALSTAYSANDYKADYCSSGRTGGAKSVPYNFVNVTPGTNQNLDMENTGTDAGTYEIIPFNDLYKTSDGTQTLASASALAEAVGQGGCAGLSAPGGQGTYYAQVIDMAQEALVTQQASYPGSKNVMIVLSDGDATASAASGPIVADNACSQHGGRQLPDTGRVRAARILPEQRTAFVTATTALRYRRPSGMCGQAVWAAQQAAQPGGACYTIGFGSETSGCTSDQTYTLTGLNNGAEAWPGGSHARTPLHLRDCGNGFERKHVLFRCFKGMPGSQRGKRQVTSLAQIFQAVVAG